MHVSEVSLTFFRANLRKMRKTRFIDFPAELEFCLKNSHPRVLVLRSCFFLDVTQRLCDIRKKAAWETTYYQGVAGSGNPDIILAKPAAIFQLAIIKICTIFLDV